MATPLAVPASYGKLTLPRNDERKAYRLIHADVFSKIVEQWQKTQELKDLNLNPTTAKKIEETIQIPPDTKSAIDKILQCDQNSHADILGVSETATPKETLDAWRRLGCLVQPYMKDSDGKQALIRNNKLPSLRESLTNSGHLQDSARPRNVEESSGLKWRKSFIGTE